MTATYSTRKTPVTADSLDLYMTHVQQSRPPKLDVTIDPTDGSFNYDAWIAGFKQAEALGDVDCGSYVCPVCSIARLMS